LLCEACEEAGEKKMAVDAFGRHIDAFQDKYGTDKASIRTYQKVCEVYYAQKDKLGGLAYGDLILMRFPEGEMADRVQMLIGDYYESMRNYDAGIRQMQALIKLRPGTALAWRAKDNMARMFYNSKRPDEAISLWREMAEAATDNQRSEYYFRIGIHLYARGSSFYVEAMKCFRWVIENGKGPDYKRPAQEMLARINAFVTGA
ncbi:MAG: hypothetical protein GX748_10565, partial [Lentisphaerae bacterium]|nr:hypothetical protein [Lentisphaerota bacterium]